MTLSQQHQPSALKTLERCFIFLSDNYVELSDKSVWTFVFRGLYFSTDLAGRLLELYLILFELFSYYIILCKSNKRQESGTFERKRVSAHLKNPVVLFSCKVTYCWKLDHLTNTGNRTTNMCDDAPCTTMIPTEKENTWVYVHVCVCVCVFDLQTTGELWGLMKSNCMSLSLFNEGPLFPSWRSSPRLSLSLSLALSGLNNSLMRNKQIRAVVQMQ